MPGTGAEEIRGCSDTLREMWTMITTAMLVLSLMLMLLSWVGGRRAKATRSTSLEFAGGSLASDRTHHTRIPHRSLIPYTATMDAVKDLAETPQRFIKEGTQVSERAWARSGHRWPLRAGIHCSKHLLTDYSCIRPQFVTRCTKPDQKGERRLRVSPNGRS